MQLKRWDTGEVIFEMECDSWGDLLKGALRAKVSFYRADLSDTDLRYAYFRDTDLRDTDLRYANLSYIVGNMREIKSMQLEEYMIVFTNDILCIGCHQHTIEEWASFTDEEISEMDVGAMEWWNKWKEFIFTAIEMTKDTK